MSSIFRETYSEINLKNLYSNYKSVKGIVKNKSIIPVVKANAYGHGVLKVVEYLYQRNIDYFAVATLEEALEIREFFPHVHILVMGVVQSKYFNIAAGKNITLSISNMDQVFGISSLSKTLKVHIKFDSGMNRLGFQNENELLNALHNLNSNSFINLEGIFTHFSTADCDYEYYKYQLNRFKHVLKALHYDFKMIHVSNSSSAIKYERELDFTTHVRLGISLYGLTLDQETKFLKNTYKLITHISEIKNLDAGDKLGYGATYTASKKEKIGVLPIGYADGFIRKNRDSFVEINSKLYPIVGTICMDQMFIKIDEDVSKEEDVIMFGNLISIDDVATRLGTINYEVVCQISYRVPKIYIE